MPDMTDKQLHLTFIQDSIKRMSGNSFMIKGWSVTLVSVLLAFSAKDGLPISLAATFLPVFLFWALDAYYLNIERSFRTLFEHVRQKDLASIDFSMRPSKTENQFRSMFSSILSRTVLPFYAALLSAIETVRIVAGQTSTVSYLKKLLVLLL
jgi:hypothetical protein